MKESFVQKGLLWPFAIVALLLSSVAMMTAFVVAARSDGGAQVLESYYENAVSWDSIAVVQNAVQVRNWVSVLTLSGGKGTLTVLDANRKKVSNLTGVVIVSRPHIAKVQAPLSITPNPLDSTYSFQASTPQPGLWDFKFELIDPSGRLDIQLRKEVKFSTP